MPTIEQRDAQPYVSVTERVTMTTFSRVADRLPELFGWLAARGAAPAGAPFFKYNRIDMAAGLEVEAGIPVAAPVPGDGTVDAKLLPAGRYAVVRHHGHPDELVDVTRDLLAWADAEGLAFDTDGERWAARLESYLTNPAEQPDMARWDVELAFRLAG